MARTFIPADGLQRSDAAYAIYRACMYQPTPEKYAALLDTLAPENAYACLEDGALAGLVFVVPNGEGGVEVLGIAVAEALRGRGIGRYMVRRLLEAVPCSTLTAETDDDAVDFYRRCGFAVTRFVRAYPDGEAVRYRCVLAEQEEERMHNMYQSQEYSGDKAEMYALLVEQLRALVEGERSVVANLANASALLADVLERTNWAGFYLMDGGELLLGPFQGKPACIRIQVGKGVCGTAVATRSTQRVADVHAFPGHIACDSASNSEIVVPLFADGVVIGVLDIDSPEKDRFDAVDQEGLESFARALETACDWH